MTPANTKRPTRSSRSKRPSARESTRKVAEPVATERFDALEPDLLADRYELGPVIGRGATGIVRRGHDRALGRDVAIKFLYPHLVEDEAARDRFLREAKLAARLQHPHAVAVFDVGDVSEPFIVMELLAGGTLADRIVEAPLDSSTAVALGTQLLSALESAHESGVIHRDIKPANIMFTRDGTAKLVDFGIATSADGPRHTTTNVVLGTLSYLAPERLSGARASVASDLYAVGVVLYEAVTGAPPFIADSPVALLHEISNTSKAPDLLATAPDADPALAAALRRALARAPQHRFSTAAEMAAALHSDSSASTHRSASLKTSVRNPGVSLQRTVVGVLAALLLALGLVAAFDGGDDAPEEQRTEVAVETGEVPSLEQTLDALDAAVRGQ